MALEDKIIPNQYKNIDLENNNFMRTRKGKDVLPKIIFLILAFVVVLVAEIIVYQSYGANFNDLIFGAIAALVLVVLLAISLFGGNKHLNNSQHLYFFHPEVTKYKIVDNFSDSSVDNVAGDSNVSIADIDENGEKVYFAEEVFDDEDDIFVIEAASTALEKEKETTYTDLINELNEALESYGITGDLALKLFSAMSFSNLIDITNAKDTVPYLFKIFNLPTYVIHYSEEESITSQRVLQNTFEYAKVNQNSPVFIYFDGVASRDFLNYLRPLYRYIDDPNGDYYISINGVAMHIPHNVFFLYSLKERDSIFDVSRRYLRYISILKADYSIAKDYEGEHKSFTLTFSQLNNARRNATDNFAVEEANYKKLDQLFVMANEANGYVLQNKIQRKMELYSSVLLSYGLIEEDVLDLCLANNVIAAVVISSEPQKLNNDYNLSRLLDNEFGADKMKLTKGMIKEYLSLFNAKGERVDE